MQAILTGRDDNGAARAAGGKRCGDGGPNVVALAGLAAVAQHVADAAGGLGGVCGLGADSSGELGGHHCAVPCGEEEKEADVHSFFSLFLSGLLQSYEP